MTQRRNPHIPPLSCVVGFGDERTRPRSDVPAAGSMPPAPSQEQGWSSSAVRACQASAPQVVAHRRPVGRGRRRPSNAATVATPTRFEHMITLGRGRASSSSRRPPRRSSRPRTRVAMITGGLAGLSTSRSATLWGEAKAAAYVHGGSEPDVTEPNRYRSAPVQRHRSPDTVPIGHRRRRRVPSLAPRMRGADAGSHHRSASPNAPMAEPLHPPKRPYLARRVPRPNPPSGQSSPPPARRSAPTPHSGASPSRRGDSEACGRGDGP